MKRVRHAPATAVRSRLDITGVVQGVGFRPAVARIADARGVTGIVYNDSGSVHCEFEGALPRMSRTAIADRSLEAPPPMARIDALSGDGHPVERGTAGSASSQSAVHRYQARTLVPPDIGDLCADCLREMNDPSRSSTTAIRSSRVPTAGRATR